MSRRRSPITRAATLRALCAEVAHRLRSSPVLGSVSCELSGVYSDALHCSRLLPPRFLAHVPVSPPSSPASFHLWYSQRAERCRTGGRQVFCVQARRVHANARCAFAHHAAAKTHAFSPAGLHVTRRSRAQDLKKTGSTTAGEARDSGGEFMKNILCTNYYRTRIPRHARASAPSASSPSRGYPLSHSKATPANARQCHDIVGAAQRLQQRAHVSRRQYPLRPICGASSSRRFERSSTRTRKTASQRQLRRRSRHPQAVRP
ncbi:hypothetical protein BKA93DRAFT_560755 [Sparassis latifolia]